MVAYMIQLSTDHFTYAEMPLKQGNKRILESRCFTKTNAFGTYT